MDERPLVSPEKLLRQFRDWVDETELPGRTVSYLKTGFLPGLFVEHADADGVEAMAAAWAGWEKGDTHPSEVLDVLRENDFEGFLTSLGASEDE